MYNYVLNKLKAQTEVYEQKLESTIIKQGSQEGSNIYAYLRSKNGYGGECLVFAVPLDYRPSIAYALTFVDAMARRKPDWQSKDVLVLFYPETEYASAVREFIAAYYDAGSEGIKGRSGYMR